MSAARRSRLVLVVGVGRSGTSLLTGILGQLGLHIPTPEVKADETNPRGFGEPRWVVDFHSRLLRAERVTVNDARPAGFAKLAASTAVAEAHDELRDWLARELAGNDAVVVKDPRTVWFLPLWTRVARELDADTSFVTMLRHPTEVLTSARKSYGTWQSEASRAAAWVNITLETERITRGTHRAFVRYDDLLADWHTQVQRIGPLLDVPALTSLDEAARRRVDEFVDPTLHRNRVRWDDVDVPAHLRDLADGVWQQLQPLAEPDGDTPAAAAGLDAAHDAYTQLYAEAEAISQSSVAAAKARRRKPDAPAAPPSLRIRVARRIPAPYRRRIRRALGRLRGGGTPAARS